MTAGAAITSSAWSGFGQDVRYGWRVLRRQPAFTAIAILTMTLGIGASVTLFSVTYGVLLRPLPWPESDRLVRLTESRQGRSPRIRGTITNATYNAWHERHETIQDIGGWRNIPTTAVIGGGREATRLQMTAGQPSLFAVLQARPLRGRLL